MKKEIEESNSIRFIFYNCCYNCEFMLGMCKKLNLTVEQIYAKTNNIANNLCEVTCDLFKRNKKRIDAIEKRKIIHKITNN